MKDKEGLSHLEYRTVKSQMTRARMLCQSKIPSEVPVLSTPVTWVSFFMGVGAMISFRPGLQVRSGGIERDTEGAF